MFLKILFAIFFTVLFHSCKTYDDISSIRLKEGKKKQYILGGLSAYETQQVINLPDSIALQKKYEFDTVKFLSRTHFREQDIYNRWRRGIMTLRNFQWAINYYRIDTSKLSTSSFYDAETIFALGRKGADCFIIPDYNNNNILTDDKPVIVPNFFESKRTPWDRDDLSTATIRNLQFFYNGELTSGTQEISIRAFKTDTVIADIKRLTGWVLNVYLHDYNFGRIKAGNAKYHVIATNWWQGLMNDSKVGFVFAEKNERNFLKLPHDTTRIKYLFDTVVLNNNQYIIERITPFQNTLTLRKIK